MPNVPASTEHTVRRSIAAVGNDPADVPTAIAIDRMVRRTIKQNLFRAAIYNLIAIPIAAGILYPASACCRASSGPPC